MNQNIIILPCYNEAARLDPARLLAFSEKFPDFQLLAVDDGSGDHTADLLRSHGVAVLVLEHNCGKGEAVRQGALAALAQGAETVGYFDADLATPLEILPEWLAYLQTHPEIRMITGCRLLRLGARIQRRFLRHLIGRALATAFSLFLRLPVYDTQCGAKLLRRELAAEVFAEPFVSRWLFDVEILRRMGRRAALAGVYEFPLPVWLDVAGSKLKMYHVFRILREFFLLVRHYGVERN